MIKTKIDTFIIVSKFILIQERKPSRESLMVWHSSDSVCYLCVCITKLPQQRDDINNIIFEFILYCLSVILSMFFFAAHHQHQNFKGSYHINNNIAGQNKIKHALHNNGNNNNNNNNTSHSPNSRPNIMKSKKQRTMQRGTGDCVR